MTDQKNINDWINSHMDVKDTSSLPSNDAIESAKHFGLYDFIEQWDGDIARINGVNILFGLYDFHNKFAARVCQSDTKDYTYWLYDANHIAQVLNSEMEWLNRPMIVHIALYGDWASNPNDENLVLLNQYLRTGWEIKHIETDPNSTNDWRRYTLIRTE